MALFIPEVLAVMLRHCDRLCESIFDWFECTDANIDWGGLPFAEVHEVKCSGGLKVGRCHSTQGALLYLNLQGLLHTMKTL